MKTLLFSALGFLCGLATMFFLMTKFWLYNDNVYVTESTVHFYPPSKSSAEVVQSLQIQAYAFNHQKAKCKIFFFEEITGDITIKYCYSLGYNLEEAHRYVNSWMDNVRTEAASKNR